MVTQEPVPEMNTDSPFQNPYPPLPEHIQAMNILKAGYDHDLLTSWQQVFTASCLHTLRSGFKLTNKQARCAIRNAKLVLPQLELLNAYIPAIPFHQNKPLPKN